MFLALLLSLCRHVSAQELNWKRIPIQEIEELDSLFFSKANPNDSTLKVMLKWEVDKFDITPEIHETMELIIFFLSQMDIESVEITSYGLFPYDFAIYYDFVRAEKLYDNYFSRLSQVKIFTIVSMEARDYSEYRGVATNRLLLLIKLNQ